MITKFKQWTLISISFFIFSCDSSEEKRASFKTSELNAEVICPAGDIPNDFNLLKIPTFFNIALVSIGDQEIKVIIPDARISKGTKVGIEPIAQLSFTQDSLLHQFLLSYPMPKDTTPEAILLAEVNMKKLPELKRIIKSWFMSNCDYGDCKNFKWKNNFQTKAVLNSLADEKYK